MSESITDLTSPELLKYLSGEISFETWLEKQQQQADEVPQLSSSQVQDSDDYGQSQSFLTAESSSIFSSWGDTFTKSSKGSIDQHGGTDDITQDLEDADCDYNEKFEDDFYQPAAVSSTESDHESVSSNDLKLPDLTNLPKADSDDSQLQSHHLQPFIQTLYQLIPTSKVNKKSKNTAEKTDEIPDIMKDFHDFQLRKRAVKRGPNAKQKKLPELCRLQMGQANLLVAKGDFKQAAEICMEVVREAPNSGIPFKTLAFIYEEQGDQEMSLQYSLISAFLDCKDAQEWKDLSKRCTDAGNIKQAAVCLDRASKAKPTDVYLQWERASLYFSNHDFRKALDIYQIILKLLLPSNERVYMELAKDMAKLFHQLGLTDKAGDTLEAAFANCPLYYDSEGLNILSEILIGAKKYEKTIKFISSHCHVELPSQFTESGEKTKKKEKASLHNLNLLINKALIEDFQDITSSSSQLNLNPQISETLTLTESADILQPVQSFENDTYEIPDAVPLDLRIKFAVCLIHVNEFATIESIIHPLYAENLETVGDLVLDIAEAFFEMGRYEEALKHLLELVESEKFNQAMVWWKIAECYENLQNVEKMIESYYQVLSLAPLQASVRLKLASALRSVGKSEKAIEVLAEYDEACVDEEGEEKITINEKSRLKIEEYEGWYRKCLVMYQEGRLRDFIYHGYILMYNYLLSGYSAQKKQTVGKIHFWEFMLKILNVSVKLMEYKKAMNLLEQALVFKPYTESKKYRLELDYLQTTLFYVAGEYSKAFDSFRLLLMHESNRVISNNALWNLFSQIVNKMLDKRHHRFTLRLLFKRPRLIPLIIQNGNNSHMSGTYKYAIGEFARAFREWPTYPLNSLLLGISFLHLSCQKFHTTRHTSILHGMIFMFQYFNLHGKDQESYYNVARAFHQIGLIHFAVYYYNKALAFPLHNEEHGDNSKEVQYHPYIDLHREAAYNLSLIYKASGNVDLARQILYKYCWV